MNTEKIIRLIEQDDDMSQMQKNHFIGFISRANEAKKKHYEDILLIEQVANDKNVLAILLSNDDVIIYSIYGKDEFSIKYPIRSIFKDNGKWVMNCAASPTFDVAFLNYLEKKHIGLNSQFTDFAMKMLGIKID